MPTPKWFHRFRDTSSWPGSLLSSVTANVIYTVGVALLTGIIVGIIALIEKLGYAISISLLLFVVQAILVAAVQIQRLYHSRSLMPSRDETAKQKHLSEWLTHMLQEAHETMTTQQIQDWIYRIHVTIWVLLEQADVDKFNAIRSQFANLTSGVGVPASIVATPITRKTQIEVKEFLGAVAIKYSAPVGL